MPRKVLGVVQNGYISCKTKTVKTRSYPERPADMLCKNYSMVQEKLLGTNIPYQRRLAGACEAAK